MEILASDLQFPEGPVAMPDGSIILVEIARETLSRVTPDGRVEVVASMRGGPNGAALGPGGKMYVCNNGGVFWLKARGTFPPPLQSADHVGGGLEIVALGTGEDEARYLRRGDEPAHRPDAPAVRPHRG